MLGYLSIVNLCLPLSLHSEFNMEGAGNYSLNAIWGFSCPQQNVLSGRIMLTQLVILRLYSSILWLGNFNCAVFINFKGLYMHINFWRIWGPLTRILFPNQTLFSLHVYICVSIVHAVSSFLQVLWSCSLVWTHFDTELCLAWYCFHAVTIRFISLYMVNYIMIPSPHSFVDHMMQSAQMRICMVHKWVFLKWASIWFTNGHLYGVQMSISYFYVSLINLPKDVFFFW